MSTSEFCSQCVLLNLAPAVQSHGICSCFQWVARLHFPLKILQCLRCANQWDLFFHWLFTGSSLDHHCPKFICKIPSENCGQFCSLGVFYNSCVYFVSRLSRLSHMHFLSSEPKLLLIRLSPSRMPSRPPITSHQPPVITETDNHHDHLNEIVVVMTWWHDYIYIMTTATVITNMFFAVCIHQAHPKLKAGNVGTSNH